VPTAQRAALTAALTSVARSLASVDGSNREYDRALVDLTAASSAWIQRTWRAASWRPAPRCGTPPEPTKPQGPRAGTDLGFPCRWAILGSNQ
jgi:hypothetical protein